jgi:peptidoglycan/LPS O-acetylase OafA/YrhL
MKNSPLNSFPTRNFSFGNYYPALDGLRGLAIVLIILYHNFDFISIFRSGWIGLDLFFVLSGFLITGILLKQRGSRHFLGNFYARRALRILPIYYLSLILFLFILPKIVSYSFNPKYFIRNQKWFWFEIQNWLFILYPGGNNNFLNHFWSLALEEQFYLISPLIILLIKPIQKIISFLLILLLILLVSRLLTWLLQFDNISYADLYTFTRIDGLCVGSILAVFKYQGNTEMGKRNKFLILILFILIFIALPFIKVFYNSRIPYLACCLFPAVALFWGLIVWTSINPENFLFKIFNSRVLIYLGKISYGVYIFHWPITWLFNSGLLVFPGLYNSMTANLFKSVISTSVAIILAIISYYTYERFFLGLKKYFI